MTRILLNIAALALTGFVLGLIFDPPVSYAVSFVAGGIIGWFFLGPTVARYLENRRHTHYSARF